MFSQYKIVIDPGHGGEDSGAVGSVYQEKELNLQMAKMLYDMLLQRHEFIPILTRDIDEFVSLSNRVSFANRNEADLFVSIHCNASTSPRPHDCQIYYYNTVKDKPLADLIFAEVDGIDGITSKWSRVEHGNFLVLRRFSDTQVVSVLVEVGFISNKRDELMLGDEAFQREFVTGILNGIVKYFS
jgi:N-acetylmuramoyl-L-alanine amidase